MQSIDSIADVTSEGSVIASDITCECLEIDTITGDLYATQYWTNKIVKITTGMLIDSQCWEI